MSTETLISVIINHLLIILISYKCMYKVMVMRPSFVDGREDSYVAVLKTFLVVAHYDSATELFLHRPQVKSAKSAGDAVQISSWTPSALVRHMLYFGAKYVKTRPQMCSELQ